MKTSMLVLLSTCIMLLFMPTLGNVQVHGVTLQQPSQNVNPPTDIFIAFLFTSNSPYSFNYTAFCFSTSAGCGASNSLVIFRGIVNINGVQTRVSGVVLMSVFVTVVYPDCTRYIFIAHPTSGPLEGGSIFGKACFGTNVPGTVVVHDANDNVVYGRDGTGSALLRTINPGD